MNKFNTLADVWAAVDAGHIVYWASDAYTLTIEDVNQEYRERMGWKPTYSQRGAKALRVTCTSNGFGSYLSESELGSLYIKD